MKIGKVLFLTLLLVVSAFAIIYKTIPVRGTNLEYLLHNNRSWHNCSASERDDIISIMKNISDISIPYFDSRIFVLTDSKADMNEQLRKTLSQEKSVFLPFHRTFNNDVQLTFATVLILRSTRKVKFLIHATSVDNAANIFKNMSFILPDGYISAGNTAFALTLLKTTEDVNEKLRKEIETFSKTSKRLDIQKFVESLKKDDKASIAIYSKSSSANPEFIKHLSNNKDETDSFQRFNLSENIKHLQICAVERVTQLVKSDMSELTENIADIVPQPQNSDIVATMCNCLWTFGMTKVPIFQVYVDNLFACLREPEYMLNLNLFPKSNFLLPNSKVIDMVFFLAEDGDFRKASAEWRLPLAGFQLKNTVALDKWYQRTEYDLFEPRKVVQRCNITKGEYKLILNGNVVRLSDLNLQLCSKELKIIEVFALEKVIIDTDVILIGKEIEFIIIAPTWEVIASSNGGVNKGRVINLSGSDASNYEEQQAKSGNLKGNRNGAHGKAGRPGGPAGSFYGIADEIINAENLAILANGGNGGNGQHGGHGVKGAGGEYYNGVPALLCDNKLPGWNFSTNYTTLPNFGFSHELTFLYTYTIMGKAGKFGGSGGNGGIGGLSGKRGHTNVLELSKPNASLIHFSTTDGKSGSNGIGGNPGRGGKNGKIVSMLCHTAFAFGEETKRGSPYGWKKLPIDTGNAKDGLRGKSGTSLKMQTVAKDSHVAQSFPTSINRYKTYIRSYLADSNYTDKTRLLTFYNSLNTQENITKLYDTLGLVEDFIEMEKQLFSLGKKMNFTYSYEQLKKRIDTYGDIPQKDEDTDEYKKIIKDLKADTSDRLQSVKSLNSHYDVNPYFQNLESRYLQPLLIDLENDKNINEVFHLLKRNLNLLEKKIKGGEKLINDVALNAISDLENTLDAELDFLLIEITELEKEIQVNQTELTENRKKLEGTMQLKALFGILKFGCAALGVINPALGFVGGIATSAIGVIEAKTTDNRSAFVAVIPKSLEKLTKHSEEYFAHLKKKQDKIVEEQEKFINNTKESTTPYGINLINQVWSSTEMYRSANNEQTLAKNMSYSIVQIYAQQEKKLTEELKELEEFKYVDSMKINATKIGIATAKYLKITSEVFKTGSETALSIMKDETKLKEIDLAFEKNEKAIASLRVMEENIYSNVQPLLDSMNTNIGKVADDLNKMNEFEQEIAKWNVTDIIKDIKRTLNNVTKSFKVNEDMNTTFEKLISTFDLLFKMHESLLNTKEKKQDKIDQTNLHIAHASNLEISDSNLRYALAELQVLLSTNKIAEKYHEWIFSFKQYAFPYTGLDFKNLQNFENHIQSDIYEFSEFIARNIKFIIADSASLKFGERRKTIVFPGSNSGDSFYIWRNKENKKAIYNILNGQNTTFFADISKSGLHFDAIKFNRIKILFTTKNPKKQEELTNQLAQYIVKITHHGDSKYMVGNLTYEINNTPTALEFNYAGNSTDGEIDIVDNLAKGPFMLSPYATWTIQLEKKKHDETEFVSLQKFRDIVDLELIGNGKVLKDFHCDALCEERMKKYYTIAY